MTVSFLTSESSTATTVTALDETVLGLDSLDKDLQKHNILREHHVAYMHPRWKFSLEGDRKRFLSNSSPCLKTKLLESRVRDRSRSRLRRLQDRRNQRKRVIRSAASMIQAVFRKHRRRRLSQQERALQGARTLADSRNQAAFRSAVGLVSSGFAAGLISVAASFISTITMQLSSILFWMTIFVLIDVAAADGTSLSNNHATGSIVALASACIAAATAIAPPCRKKKKKRSRSNIDDDDYVINQDT